MSHRWSGWPGAVCLDCLVLDQTEQCVADGCWDFESGKCSKGHTEISCPGCPDCHRSGFGDWEMEISGPRCSCGRPKLP